MRQSKFCLKRRMATTPFHVYLASPPAPLCRLTSIAPKSSIDVFFCDHHLRNARFDSERQFVEDHTEIVEYTYLALRYTRGRLAKWADSQGYRTNVIGTTIPRSAPCSISFSGNSVFTGHLELWIGKRPNLRGGFPSNRGGRYPGRAQLMWHRLPPRWNKGARASRP
jgi:hypothetical protein